MIWPDIGNYDYNQSPRVAHIIVLGIDIIISIAIFIVQRIFMIDCMLSI